MGTMTSDEGRKAEAWYALKVKLARERIENPQPALDLIAACRRQFGPAAGLPMPAYCAVPVFVGIDLAADESGGFTPEIQIGGFPGACFDGCSSPYDCVQWGCAKGHGKPPRDMTRHPAPTAGRLEI